MHRAISTLLLVFASNSAVAQWIYVGSDDTKYVYYDSDTIRRAGEWAGMLVLLDSKEADENRPFMSAKIKSEFKCKEASFRLTGGYVYSGKMGTGESEKHDVNMPWRSIQPVSAWEDLLKIACWKQPQ